VTGAGALPPLVADRRSAPPVGPGRACGAAGAPGDGGGDGGQTLSGGTARPADVPHPDLAVPGGQIDAVRREAPCASGAEQAEEAPSLVRAG
jgi:hypothetical protein